MEYRGYVRRYKNATFPRDWNTNVGRLHRTSRALRTVRNAAYGCRPVEAPKPCSQAPEAVRVTGRGPSASLLSRAIASADRPVTPGKRPFTQLFNEFLRPARYHVCVRYFSLNAQDVRDG
jgi:hypothetical protein